MPSEAINALTVNGAAAMEVSETNGSITVDKNATLIVTKPVTGIDYLPYSYAQGWIDKVAIGGKVI